jgi:linear primary-alkylsulfatase
VALDRATLNGIILRELPLAEAIAQGRITIAGDAGRLAELFALLDDFSIGFPVVEPHRARVRPLALAPKLASICPRA